MKEYKRVVNNKMKCFGKTDTSKKLISLNKAKCKKDGSKGEMIDTIFHEELHRIHPKAKEKTIIKMTEKKTKRASKEEKNRLYKKYHV